ncbi:MAG: hypothetical protein IPK82_10665 [Polyangiaceae bacterium]|nr:hypothetical protein [Polyangiaceae bacterium]
MRTHSPERIEAPPLIAAPWFVFAAISGALRAPSMRTHGVERGRAARGKMCTQ